MKLIRNPRKAYRYLSLLKVEGKTIGFVPTMGYLHEGHLSLIKKARRENDIVVVSIFVNTLQFGPREDYESYPKDFKRDKALARDAGADLIFNPGIRAMYTGNHSTFVNVRKLPENLCGRFRPRHFRGVATVVTKLLNIVPADTAYFGQKDAQQAFIIMKMVKDLNMPVAIKMLPIVREKDGLAMSSRNIYLDTKQRREAAVLYRSLCLAEKIIKTGKRDSKNIIKKMKNLIQGESSAKVQYISIVDIDRLKDVKKIKGRVLIALAAYFGRIRLIDNIIVRRK
ncbi:MAG: pantoate--beta-alanine ligase [Candidatus Omnitrophota bacterium]|nr:pantoate--beta-alanine ligase [Candidatus Omnitrophota bacterium]